MTAKPRPELKQTKHKPKYDYRGDCEHYVERDFREATFVGRCDVCEETRLFSRVFSAPFVKPMMHEHYNNAVGKPISDMGQFKEELKKSSEAAWKHSGIEHDFQPREMGDHEGIGATGEGVYESNKVRSRKGEVLLPEIPGQV